MNHKRGFTLIELLVVIAIIGLLSSVVLASLNTARSKGRDALRKENIHSLKEALDMYYITNGTYPQYGTTNAGYDITNLSSYLVPTYIPSIPLDPQGQSDQYVWGNNGNAYAMLVYAESGGNPSTLSYSGYCVTGVGVNSGWWANPNNPIGDPQPVACKF